MFEITWINHTICRAVLLAQQGRLGDLARPFKGRRTRIDVGDVVAGLLILAGIIAAAWLLYRLLAQLERRGSYFSSGALFLALCRAHRLGWSQQRLLWRVAWFHRLREPARLFLEPERFDPMQLDPAWRLYAAELDRLRRVLFADPQKQEPDQQRPATPLSPPPISPTLDIPPWTGQTGPNTELRTSDQ
ncbi:MAG: hypothetical protein JXB62_12190 [Pirellulales bacterium]|nr:hypothetical protein [Pirellulales bacterium]